eukprot:TRINITY_DN24888_c0_g1_i1.p1 TRINITY_DN24888_c0_g1~~TRINITY_DN24888_c0_g1_i1.p1  ORF type:complete len:494 (-),score=107.31 TRINITY_DN24888_c0_g1_i1:708-2078(-)
MATAQNGCLPGPLMLPLEKTFGSDALEGTAKSRSTSAGSSSSPSTSAALGASPLVDNAEARLLPPPGLFHRAPGSRRSSCPDVRPVSLEAALQQAKPVRSCPATMEEAELASFVRGLAPPPGLEGLSRSKSVDCELEAMVSALLGDSTTELEGGLGMGPPPPPLAPPQLLDESLAFSLATTLPPPAGMVGLQPFGAQHAVPAGSPVVGHALQTPALTFAQRLPPPPPVQPPAMPPAAPVSLAAALGGGSQYFPAVEASLPFGLPAVTSTAAALVPAGPAPLPLDALLPAAAPPSFHAPRFGAPWDAALAAALPPAAPTLASVPVSMPPGVHAPCMPCVSVPVPAAPPAAFYQVPQVPPPPCATAPVLAAPEVPPPPAMTEKADLAPAFPVGCVEIPTVGSAGHMTGRCKPCAFFYSKGCQSGMNCEFCHLCPEGEKKRRQKQRREDASQRKSREAA